MSDQLPARVSPVEAFKMQVLPPDKRADVLSALPSHVKPERFERNLVNALMQNPDLMRCDARLVFREVSKAAALGLLLDPQLGEAYLIVGWNGKKQTQEPQLRVGYRGIMKLARQSGEVAKLYAHEVRANDEVECVLGDQKRLVHRPMLFGERGPVIGYYAVAVFSDGETDFEPMTVSEIHAIRDRSDAWKAHKAGKIKSTPWGTDEIEMGKKTVMRRLLKRLPQSPELAQAIHHEDAAEAVVMPAAPAAHTSAPTPRTLASKLDAIAAPEPEEAEVTEIEGEIDEERVEDLRVAEEPEPQKAEPAPRESRRAAEVPPHDPETGEVNEPAPQAAPVDDASAGVAEIRKHAKRAADRGDEEVPPKGYGARAKSIWILAFKERMAELEADAREPNE
jgi:recombination protein RecT